MFHSARIKLTAWYLLIIMLISVSFSVVMYRILASELNRVEAAHRLSIERGLPDQPDLVFPPNMDAELHLRLLLDPNLIQETENRLKVFLAIVNFAILGSSAVAGYFLAGRTLKPIGQMVEEQKQFISDASHELRTPLTSMKTSIEIALRKKRITSGEAKEILTSNLEDINNLQSLTDDLLSFDYYQQGSSNLICNPTDFIEVVRNVQKNIVTLANDKNIKLKFDAINQVIEADQKGLEKMIIILLDNAIKYTPEKGKVLFSAKVNKKNIIIQVKDNGIGIAKKDLPHIFDRFYRADQSRSKANITGFGLGLALAKRIVDLHRGTITVNSILGKGTTFIVKLPLCHS